MKKALTISLIAFLCAGAAVYAAKQPHEGKITSIDMDQKSIAVAGEHDQTWTLYWNETTKVKDAKVEDLKVGDTIHFDFKKDKDGKMWATEIHRTAKAAM
ncbi:MAG TPA: copper-binding protein [Thermoanaerobaculia bacterium]